MKLATFRITTPVGPFDRLGIVRLSGGDARHPAGHVVDANFAYAAIAAAAGAPSPNVRADAYCPADLQAYAELHGCSLDILDEVAAWAEAEDLFADPAARSGPRGERIVYGLDEVQFRPPIGRVPVLRDFAAFEDHLKTTFGKMGLEIPAVWYERPTAFKGNPTTLYGHGETVPWPAFTEKLDYELELAAVIGAPGADIDVARAGDHVLGYTLLNDFSARDVQAGEMAMSTGPYKGKDFAWGLGPWIVTPDEVGDPAALTMRVHVNGEVWAESTPREMQWTFDEVISYTSQDERLTVGEVFGSGTVNRGCGFEIDRWIQPGDVVELEADRVGVLRHIIGHSGGSLVRWRRPS